MSELGFEVITVAGQGTADRIVPGLGIGDAEHAVTPDPSVLGDALRDADLVVVENLCTIPLNLSASRAVAAELAGRPAILHHHDPPWHRERFTHITELPSTDPAWQHVAITRHAAVELADRAKIEAVVIHNGFPAPLLGDRIAQRSALGVADDELLLAHPVRAIERKNIGAAIDMTESMGATYWLLGDAEEGYGPALDDLLGRASCRVVRQPCTVTADIYGAADGVVFPSTWEGFGNPPIEAALHHRPVAVGHYPFADELRTLGFGFVEPNDALAMSRRIQHPDLDELQRNHELALEHFGLDRVRHQLRTLLERAGWMP